MSLISKIFGGGKDKSPSAAEAIQKLKETELMLTKKQEFLEAKIEQELSTAKKNGTKNKRVALQALKRKKRYEKQLQQIDGTLSTIELQREALEGATSNTAVFQAMNEAAKSLKGVHQSLRSNWNLSKSVTKTKSSPKKTVSPKTRKRKLNRLESGESSDSDDEVSPSAVKPILEENEDKTVGEEKEETKCVVNAEEKKPEPAPKPKTRRGKDRVENFRQRRCNPAGGEKWLDHRSGVSVPLGTILQPLMRKRKSVTELGSAQDVGKCDRYVLTTQDKDSSGELETRLYKGNVFPTAGGGAQVVLNDVEILKQTSPTSVKKRRVPETILPGETIDSKCKTGIAGGLSSKKSKRQL